MWKKYSFIPPASLRSVFLFKEYFLLGCTDMFCALRLISKGEYIARTLE